MLLFLFSLLLLLLLMFVFEFVDKMLFFNIELKASLFSLLKLFLLKFFFSLLLLLLFESSLLLLLLLSMDFFFNVVFTFFVVKLFFTNRLNSCRLFNFVCKSSSFSFFSSFVLIVTVLFLISFVLLLWDLSIEFSLFVKLNVFKNNFFLIGFLVLFIGEIVFF